MTLSSGEAELYAANHGAAQGLGCQSFLGDVGIGTSLNVWIDAKATMGIINRRGLGKVRHLDVNDLWLQDGSQKLTMKKIASDQNMLT